MHYKDQLHRTINLPSVPQRIVCLVPSLTELLVDLGLEDSIVGITKFCVHPSRLKKEKTIVGGTKQVHVDRIKRLNPDFILCNKEENTREIVEEASRIAPVLVSDINSVTTNNEMIVLLGKVFNKEAAAHTLVESIKREATLFEAFMQNKPSVAVIYLIWKNPYMASGTGTFIDNMLQKNKFKNILKQERYPEVPGDELKKADLVLLSSEPFPFKEKDIIEIKKELPPQVKVLLVDGEYFSWYGSRLLKAFSYFKTLHD